MNRVKLFFKRFFIFFVIVAFCTMTIFVCFNKTQTVKADVITGVALGVGALAVLTASYFSVAGVQITNSGGSESYVSGWYNDIINKYKQADIEHQQMVDTYFDENGVYIGTEEDLQFVLSDQAYGYWQMGKGVNALMEDIKNWFVTDKNLSVGTDVVISSVDSVSLYDGSFPISLSQYNNSIDCSIGVIGDSGLIRITDNLTLAYSSSYISGSNAYRTYMQAQVNTTGQVVASQTINYDVMTSLGSPHGILAFKTEGAYDNNRGNLVFGILSRNSNGLYDWSTANFTLPVAYSSLDSSAISVEGTLTDGYQDYQDALNQDLANEEDNEQAVVQVGVGELPGVLTGEQVVAGLLDQAASNTLEGTYEGVYENQQEATEDKEGEKEFVPEVPEGWVMVDGLQDFFPFCIPFDFYNFVALFDAPPEAPVIRWNMGFADIYEEQEIVLDFAPWETAAVIFRVLVIIGFSIFLILKTRDLIRG